MPDRREDVSSLIVSINLYIYIIYIYNFWKAPELKLRISGAFKLSIIKKSKHQTKAMFAGRLLTQLLWRVAVQRLQ